MNVALWFIAALIGALNIWSHIDTVPACLPYWSVIPQYISQCTYILWFPWMCRTARSHIYTFKCIGFSLARLRNHFLDLKAVGTVLGLGGQIFGGVSHLLIKRIQFCTWVGLYLWFTKSAELCVYFSLFAIQWFICPYFSTLTFWLATYWGAIAPLPPPPCSYGHRPSKHQMSRCNPSECYR